MLSKDVTAFRVASSSPHSDGLHDHATMTSSAVAPRASGKIREFTWEYCRLAETGFIPYGMEVGLGVHGA
jgi:hypothetical protein